MSPTRIPFLGALARAHKLDDLEMNRER